MAIATASFLVQRSAERFFGDHGWLKTFHSFSFAEYQDPANLNWGALRVFNDDRVAGGGGFPTHPHQNMEILTYVIDGRLEHRDTLGSHGIIDPGGVQFLSAGTGLRHSEFNGSPDRELRFLQMWILPGRLNVAPTYGQVDFDVAARHNRWLAAASGESAVDAPIRLTQLATLRVAHLESAAVEHTFEPGRFGFLFVATGSVTVSGRETGSEPQSTTLAAGDALRLSGLRDLDVSGTAEIVFWDLPPAG